MGLRKESPLVGEYVDIYGWGQYEWPRPGRRIAAAKVVEVVRGEAALVATSSPNQLRIFVPTGPSGMEHAEVGDYAVVCYDGTKTFAPASLVEAARPL